MTTRKKTKLIILTAVLVIALAVSGTLMLFTAQSETAKNVVSLGNVSVRLQESNNGQDYYTVGFDTDPQDSTQLFSGFNYGSIAPGATIEKYPRVHNAGNIPIYAFLKVELKLWDGNGQIAITELDTSGQTPVAGPAMQKYFGSDPRFLDPNGDVDLAKVRNFWNNFLTTSFQNDPSWFGLDPARVQYAADGTVTSGFFYANTNNGTDSGLTKIRPLTVSDDLFTSITMPADMPNTFQKVGFSLEITAYAVQADNNPFGSVNPADTDADKVTAMAKAFDGLTLY